MMTNLQECAVEGQIVHTLLLIEKALKTRNLFCALNNLQDNISFVNI